MIFLIVNMSVSAITILPPRTRPPKKFTEEYLPVAKAIHSAGKYFMYHNHDAEFKWENGKTILANLAEKISPRAHGIYPRYFLGAGRRR